MSKPTISKLQTEMSISLTKSDLIDMIVSDKEESLEKEIDLLNEEKIKAYEELKKLAGEHKKELIKKFKSLHSNRLKQLERFTNRKDIIFSVSLTPTYRRSVCRLAYSRCSARLAKAFDDYGTEPHTESYSWTLVHDFTSEELDNTKFFNKIKMKYSQIDKISHRIKELRAEYSELNKMGRRAKAAMVRKLLDNSEEGKKLLSSITKIEPLRLK